MSRLAPEFGPGRGRRAPGAGACRATSGVPGRVGAMLVIPYAAQAIGNRFWLVVPNPGDYEPGRFYAAQAVDPDGPYPVLAVIDAKHGNELAGTFTEG